MGRVLSEEQPRVQCLGDISLAARDSNLLAALPLVRVPKRADLSHPAHRRYASGLPSTAAPDLVRIVEKSLRAAKAERYQSALHDVDEQLTALLEQKARGENWRLVPP